MAEYCNQYYFSEDNEDHFEVIPDQGDSFQSWQGLRGPYYSPTVGADGYLYWTNNGGLPNPVPVRIVGKDGRGITLTGQCETVAELPENPQNGEAWAVGEEEPFECYAWFGEWVDLGQMFPKGDPGADGVSPEVTITDITGGHTVKITDKDHPTGQTFNVMDGQDGVSPEVTITDITGGHTVKITDKDHPTGQTFNVMDGQDGDPGPGVPSGGSAGQLLKKSSSIDYATEWYSPAAGDVAYDDSLTYAAGTVGAGLNGLRTSLNSLDSDDIANASTNVSGATVTLALDALDVRINNYETTTIEQLVQSSIVASGNSSWHNASGTFATNYKKYLIKILPEGCSGNSALLEKHDIIALGANCFQISAFWDSDALGYANIFYDNNNLCYYIEAKTKTIPFRYYIYGLK